MDEDVPPTGTAIAKHIESDRQVATPTVVIGKDLDPFDRYCASLRIMFDPTPRASSCDEHAHEAKGCELADLRRHRVSLARRGAIVHANLIADHRYIGVKIPSRPPSTRASAER